MAIAGIPASVARNIIAAMTISIARRGALATLPNHRKFVSKIMNVAQF